MQDKSWYQRNKEYSKSEQAKYRAVNRERLRLRAAEYRRNNVEKLREARKRRRHGDKRERILSLSRDYYAQNAEKRKDDVRKYQEKNRDKIRADTIRRKYGILPGDMSRMLRANCGTCDICGEIPSRTLNVDHDHGNGLVRGLLCSRCNRMLGMARDNTTILASAIRYLTRNGNGMWSHDAKNRPLESGDVVLVPCTVSEIVDSETIVVRPIASGRSPDGQTNSIGYINSKQVIRANEGDDTSFRVVEDDGKAYLR